MKKIIITSFLLLTIIYAEAQVELKPAIGFNITNVTKDPVSGQSNGQAGFQVGASVLIGTKFYVDPGVFYVKKSTEFVSEGTDFEDFKLDMAGIRIPVAIGYNLLGNEDSFANLRVFGGGSGFFVTSVDGGDADKDDVNTTSWGVFAGAGLDVWILFLDVKYEWSLTNISSVTDFDIGQNRSFFTNLGVRIRF